MSTQKDNDLLTGPIVKMIIKLAWPIVIANLLHTSYQLIDMMWVGRLGVDAVAAVALSFPVLFLIMAFGMGLSIAGTVLVSQYKGQKNKEQVDVVSGQTMSALVILAVVLSIVGYVFSEPVITLLGAEKDVIPMATDYLQISFLGVIPLFVFFVAQSLMRGIGDVKTPMYIVGGTVILNAVLDPLFIMGYGIFPALGVKGAALATVLTQTVGALICLYILGNGKHEIHLKWQNFKLQMSLLKRMIGIGLPSSIEQSAVALSLGAITMMAGMFGTDTLATYGVGNRLFGFVIIPTMGLSMATATLVGQSIGAKMLDRVHEVVNESMKLGFFVLLGIAVIMFALATPVVKLFIPHDPQVVIDTVVFVRILTVSFVFVALQKALSGAFIGSGNTLFTMGTGLVALWGVQFPVAWIASQYTSLGPIGIWISFPSSFIVSAGIAYFLFKKTNWIKKEVI